MTTLQASMWDRLPVEVQELVLAHRAAMVVQRGWRRWTLFAHTRHPHWYEIRRHLDVHGVWREMVAYAQVRREWRQEAESWTWVDTRVATVLRDEARRGMWGAFAPQFASLTPKKN